MNLLILAALTESTGNATTARRIANHLGRAHSVQLVDVHSINMNSLKEIASHHQVEIAIGLHALLAGPYLHALEIPYALIMGGTDLYQELHELQLKLMMRSVTSAGEIVAFGEENMKQAVAMWPFLKGRVRCIAQAVDLDEKDKAFNIREHLSLNKESRLILLPAGIRAIKDPFFLVKAFHELHLRRNDVHLCLVGPTLEQSFADENFKDTRGMSGIHYIPGLSRPKMLAAMEQANIVLNSSLSEGMSSAILESMALHTPVVARKNDGNISIVEHGKTGFLYDTPEEAVQFTEDLLSEAWQKKSFDNACDLYLESRHTIRQEFEAYQTMLYDILKSWKKNKSEIEE